MWNLFLLNYYITFYKVCAIYFIWLNMNTLNKHKCKGQVSDSHENIWQWHTEKCAAVYAIAIDVAHFMHLF